MNFKIKEYLTFFVITAGVLLVACNSNSNKTGSGDTAMISSSDTAVIVFDEYEHDFGRIEEGEKVGCIFKFSNTGTGPLVINSVVTSCGCTVPKYSTKPLPPGDDGTLEVEFNSSGYNGLQTKTITVRSNASKPLVLLTIRGEVVAD